MKQDELTKTILAQYATSPKLRAIIDLFNEAMNTEGFINDFYDLIWNIETADTYGLDAWGKIVDVSRNVTINQQEPDFGFYEALTDIPNEYDPEPFNEGVFYNGIQSTTTLSLSNDAYRRLIMVKAMANITDCTISELNSMMLYLFKGKGRPFVADTGSMTMKYIFPFDLSESDKTIVMSSGVIPRPSGVLVHAMSYDFDATFGFCEGDWSPFDEGTFFTENQIYQVV